MKAIFYLAAAKISYLLAFLLPGFMFKNITKPKPASPTYRYLFAFLVSSLFMVSGALGQATVTTDKDDYAPGEYVIITGTGWQPGETVSFHFDETPKPATCVNSHDIVAVADAAGKIYNNQFLIKDNHLGVAFVLTASGQSSGFSATTSFTDANVKFETSGLPAGTSITVTASYTNESGNSVSNQSVQPFNSPGPSTAIPVLKNTIVTYTFPAIAGYAAPAANSTFAQPNNNGANTITGVYTAILCTPPSINSPSGQPLPQSVIYGSDATFSVIATGTAPFTYQWQEKIGTGSFTNISDIGIYSGTAIATLTLAIPGVSLSSNQYRCLVSNSCGSNVPSNAASLTVNRATQTITWSNPANIVYGTALSSTQLNATVAGVSGGTAPGALTYTPAAGVILAAGSQTLSVTAAATANYNEATKTVTLVVDKAPTTTVVTVANATYDNTPHGGTANVTGANGLNAAVTVYYAGVSPTVYASSATAPTNAGTYSATATYAATANYLTSTDTKNFTIAKRQITITVTPGQFKYCGQVDPVFAYSYTPTITGLAGSDEFSGALTRASGEATGLYNILQTGLTIKNGATDVSANYNITYSGTQFEIKGVSIDASESGTAVQLNTASTLLKALVTDGTSPLSGVSVKFVITNNVGGAINTIGTTAPTMTDVNGKVSISFSTGSLPVGLYAVQVITNTGCSESLFAYFSIYDPNAGFVTGGGWINSPAGAFSADPSLTGKANFGFNAQYKKGNNTPDGNTQFQFQAGDLKFKSSVYNLGSLVIAGAKATFKGTGTINGSGNYDFLVSAIDGDINGGGGIDKFRIKIWNGSNIIYDNNMGTLDNGDPSTALGGGSIVIHDGKKNSAVGTLPVTTTQAAVSDDNLIAESKPIDVQVFGNPSTTSFKLKAVGGIANEKLTVRITDLNGYVLEVRTNVFAGQVIELGNQYRGGTYFAEVRQGNNRKVVKLIKTN